MIDKPEEPFAWEHDAYNNNYEDCGLTGYTGLDYHTVAQLSVMPAWRAQVGQRGFYKAGMALMPDGSLIASPVDMLAPRQRPPFSSGLVETSWPVRLHKSIDSGRSWQPMEHTPLVGKEGSLTCLENGVLLFTSESLDGVAYSDDGGTSWEHIDFKTPRADPHQAVFPVRAPIVHPDGTISFVRSVGTMEGRAPARVRLTKISGLAGTFDRWRSQLERVHPDQNLGRSLPVVRRGGLRAFARRTHPGQQPLRMVASTRGEAAALPAGCNAQRPRCRSYGTDRKQ